MAYRVATGPDLGDASILLSVPEQCRRRRFRIAVVAGPGAGAGAHVHAPKIPTGDGSTAADAANVRYGPYSCSTVLLIKVTDNNHDRQNGAEPLHRS